MSEGLLGASLISIGFFAISVLLVDVFSKNKAVSFIYSIVALAVTAGLSVYNLYLSPSVYYPANINLFVTKNMIAFGGYTSYFDLLFSLAGLFTILSSRSFLKREYMEIKEYYSLIIYSVAGMMIIGHANNLVTLFVGIEIMSICFFILAGFIRTRSQSVEASLKYFLLGAFATGFLVYGAAMLYGATGSLDFRVISQKISQAQVVPIYFVIGAALIIVGLSFKAAAFPFHQWAPDVYHGSPTVSSAFLSTAGKAAALIAFVVMAKTIIPHEVFATKLRNSAEMIKLIIAAISAATMLIGNISALVQKDVKRMLAYSSVAHAGYLLMGIVANSVLGWSAISYYMTAYIFMQMGAFFIISTIERKEAFLEITDYAGLSKSYPMIAALMSVFMLSLAGIPPFAGFFGKYYLIMSVIKSGYTWLAIVAVIASIISIYFYIGLIMQMYFREHSGNKPEFKHSGATFSIIASAVIILLIGILPNLVMETASYLF